METRNTTASSTVGQEVQTLVDALTDLARLDHPDTGRLDIGELVARVAACAAANLGSIQALTSGARLGTPYGSRLAELIADVVPAAKLFTQRTRDIELFIDVDGVFAKAGIKAQFEADFRAVRTAMERETDAFGAWELGELLPLMSQLYEDDRSEFLTTYTTAARNHLRSRSLPEHVGMNVTTRRPVRTPARDDLAIEAHTAASSEASRFVTRLAARAHYRTRAEYAVRGLTEAPAAHETGTEVA